MSTAAQKSPAPNYGRSSAGGGLLNRIHARFAIFAKPADGFLRIPEPRMIGLPARGEQLIAGNFLMAGELVESRTPSIWDIPGTGPAFQRELHGFAWLDDLAAIGDSAARNRARAWAEDWIRRFGAGSGPGWTPDLTGRRLIRWINHAALLLDGRPMDGHPAFFRSLGRQMAFLGRRWRRAAEGTPRFEALTGLLCAGLALRGMERHVAPAVRGLGVECEALIDGAGGVPSRNPEELMEVFALLTWAAGALNRSGRSPAPPHASAIERVAPTLRALRHSDGSLARFHGGGRGIEGRLDRSLAAAGVKAIANAETAMGYARLQGGRTTVIADAAPPPTGAASRDAHASTLAFELTSGRRPLIVSCGTGTPFGGEWSQSGRATPSHSTLSLEGYSSSRLGPVVAGSGIGGEILLDTPRDVRCRRIPGEDAVQLMMSHDGWSETHGVIHVRRLDLTNDGRNLSGIDTLGALTSETRSRFDRYLERFGIEEVSFRVHFHIHPDVEAKPTPDGDGISLALKSGEVWMFRCGDGAAAVELEQSIYLEKGRLKPRPTRQVVISSALSAHAAQVHWTIAKTGDTPTVIRDYQRDDAVPL